MDAKKTYGLVLGGGGARGAYHIGAWKALAKMHIDVCAVSGASIGAINGALFIQGDLLTAQDVWLKLSLSDFIRFEEELPVADNLFDLRNINQILRILLVQRGLDVEPARDLLNRYLDESVIRSSPIDLGVMTYDMTSMQPVEIFKKDIPEGALFDYLLASSSLPVFKTIKIDGNTFIDGGFYNNIPIDMLAERGIKDIIVIDPGGVELVRPPKANDLTLITIRPQVPLGGLLDMTPSIIRKSIKRGMLDTYRAFGKLTGKMYYLTMRSTARFVKTHGQEVLDGLEMAADRYGINPLRMYTPDKLLRAVEKKFLKDSEKYVLLRCNQKDELNERLMRDRPRLHKLEKDFLIPATLEILGDPTVLDAAKEIMKRLAPAQCAVASALLTLGVKMEKPCDQKQENRLNL